MSFSSTSELMSPTGRLRTKVVILSLIAWTHAFLSVIEQISNASSTLNASEAVPKCALLENDKKP